MAATHGSLLPNWALLGSLVEHEEFPVLIVGDDHSQRMIDPMTGDAAVSRSRLQRSQAVMAIGVTEGLARVGLQQTKACAHRPLAGGG